MRALSRILLLTAAAGSVAGLAWWSRARRGADEPPPSAPAATPGADAPATRLALLVGVGEYAPEAGLPPLQGAGNDLERVETLLRQPVVRTVGRAENAAELADIIVKELPGGSVRVSDVAEIVDDFREKSGFVNMNGISSVT